jgi:flagellar biosynthesis/type III secretory pathway chaperone
MGTEIAENFKVTEDNLKKFINLLQQENNLLTENFQEEVINLIEQKKALAEKFEQANQGIVSYMTSIRIPATHEALSKYINQRLPILQGSLLLKQWENIVDLLTQADKLNRENGLKLVGKKEESEKNRGLLLEKIRLNIYAIK